MTKSVLLVEDEDNIAMALEFLMRREGYDFSRVATGPAALAAIAEKTPDLLLLDVMLPGLSGYDICQKVRLDPALAHVKILMLTARGGEMERRKGEALGADAFMAKPFSTEDLKRTVRDLIGGEAA
jgi:Response regulators consisting of a CheY-like receiver domain and a winged-helix DNA-binding domain